MVQKHRHLKTVFIALTLALLTPNFGYAQATVDDKLPRYQKVPGISGNLNSVGSDTLNNMMTLWAEAFGKIYPQVNIQIEGKGSSTAPPALIAGTSQLGPMSRKMKDKEIQKFEQKYGYVPTAVGVALDALVVYVHKDNPIDSLSLEQVDAIFSVNRNGGHGNDILTWGQLGLTGEWASRPISLYGRNSASGTYGYFKKHALFKGDYKSTVKEQPGSASVVLGVSEDLGGIGYSGIGYRTSEVRGVPLSSKRVSTAQEPTYQNLLGRTYPLGRMLYVYIDKNPNEPMPRLVEEFLTFVLSYEGQQVVVKDGYLPLPHHVASRQVAGQ